MGSVNHETTTVQVWIDADIGIADCVRYLNTIPGVRTTWSCQGTIGEGGPAPFRATVGVTWENDTVLARLQSEFDMEILGPSWGEVHPRDDQDAADVQNFHLGKLPQEIMHLPATNEQIVAAFAAFRAALKAED